jgi:hypothetical protein
MVMIQALLAGKPAMATDLFIVTIHRLALVEESRHHTRAV